MFRYSSVAVWLVCALATPGCMIGRSNVSMDSNSRAPWMNLEFLPSRKKDDDVRNYHRSIAEELSSGHSEGEVTPAVAPPEKQTRLAGWLLPGSNRTPLPLPRSDVKVPDLESSRRPDWWGFE